MLLVLYLYKFILIFLFIWSLSHLSYTSFPHNCLLCVFLHFIIHHLAASFLSYKQTSHILSSCYTQSPPHVKYQLWYNSVIGSHTCSKKKKTTLPLQLHVCTYYNSRSRISKTYLLTGLEFFLCPSPNTLQANFVFLLLQEKFS